MNDEEFQKDLEAFMILLGIIVLILLTVISLGLYFIYRVATRQRSS